MSAYTYREFTIPEHMMAALQRYLNHGTRPGSFLCAVLANDLMEAVGRADNTNLHNLPAYVGWLYNEAPAHCHGSPERVDAWVKSFAQAREAVLK